MVDIVRFLAYLFVSIMALVIFYFSVANETWWLGLISGVLLLIAYKVARTGGD